MRTITLIIIHCSATPEGKDYTIQDIDRWHKARGWKGIGYHYVIYHDGSIHKDRPEEQVGAHCLNHNKHSIGICYIGGTREVRDPINHKLLIINPCDTRTEAQKRSLRALLVELKQSYPTPSSWVITSSPTKRVHVSMQQLSMLTYNLVKDYFYDFR